MRARLPRLLDREYQEITRPMPGSVSITQTITPLSTATVMIESGIAEVGQYMELYTIHGSAGIYRIEQISTARKGTDTLHLEHGLVTLSDTILTSKGEKTGTPAELLSMLLDGQSEWQLGRVDATETITWSWDYSSRLEGVKAVLEALPGYWLTFDQKTRPWTLNLVALDNEDFCELRANRNISSLQIETDRSELCTRLYVPGRAEPMDADTIDKWGVVARQLDVDTELGQEVIERQASEYLDKHKSPKIGITISAIDWFHETGEPIDRFSLGRMCRVCLSGLIIRQRITSITWSWDEAVSLTLENETTGASSIIASLIVDTTEIRKHVKTQFERVDERIIAAEKLIKLSAEDIELLAKRITANAEQITLKASKDIVDSLSETLDGALIALDGVKSELLLKVSKDGLISAINLSPEGVKIDSAKIELNGTTIVELLKGNNLDIDFLSAYQVEANEGNFETLEVAGRPAQWLESSVCTGGKGLSAVGKTQINYLDHDGNPKSQMVVISVDSYALPTKKISYLGAE